MSETWFRIALADGDGCRLVIAPGQHLGEAIELARARARRGKAAGVPVAAEPAPAGEVPLGESVGKGVVVERDAPEERAWFRWPSGVLPTLDGARALAGAAEGFTTSRHGETHVVEAVLGADRLVEVFMGVVERLPTADNVEIRVTGHLDGAGTSEVWLTPRMGDVRRAIRFLDDHDVELLGNGHVEVGVYLRKQRSTLRMTEHKTIRWLTEDDAMLDPFVGWLTAQGVAASSALPLVAEVDHYHWRPASTRNRKKLLQHLERLRLRRVDSWPDAA
jgi:hypothetical protein